MRGVCLPDGWFQLQPLQAEPNCYLPQAAAIRDQQFEPEGIRFSLRLR
ncbi:hypothetical protein ACP26L_06660 [Paenibacillus sp. S-38]